MRSLIAVLALVVAAGTAELRAAEPQADGTKSSAKSKAPMRKQYGDPIASWGYVETTPSKTADERAADKAHGRLKAWVGQDIDELIKAWGPPKSRYVDENGSSVYVFAHSGVRPTPDEATKAPVSAAGEAAAPIKFSLNFYCDVSFRVRGNERISGWRYVGNNCSWDN